MKKEIFNRGPIACGIFSTKAFHGYKTGVYTEKSYPDITNHIISVVGWGVSSEGIEYWIGRNSWGNYWGEYGFFKIKMHENNLGIEKDCVWGVPSFEAPAYRQVSE